MKLPPLTAVIEREGDWFVASCPELDVVTQGKTLEEAEAMLQQAVALFLGEADEAEVTRRVNRGVKVKKLELLNAKALSALSLQRQQTVASGSRAETANTIAR